MKTSFFSFFRLFGLFAFFSASSAWAQPGNPPNETEADQPWARIARSFLQAQATQQTDSQLKDLLTTEAPGFLETLNLDIARPELFAIWGASRNADESNPDEPIVHPKILGALSHWLYFQPADPKFQTGHAGIIHTYGYLFSILATPYGYKRARYVSGEIERGFELSVGLFGPNPKSGSLLSNFSFFLERASLGTRTLTTPVVDLDKFNYALLKKVRLLEQPNQSAITMTTDILYFTNTQNRTPNGNTALLVYAIKESATTGTKLITAFPVNDSFIDKLFEPSTMGENVSIKIKYNGRLTGNLNANAFTGSRKAQY